MNKNIEMLRWEEHQRSLKDSDKEYLRTFAETTYEYWTEFAAYVSTLPRRSGKTSFIKDLYTRLDVPGSGIISIILVPTQAQCSLYKDLHVTTPYSIDRFMLGRWLPEHTHLIIDEYAHMDLKIILSKNWKTVSMFGTLKLT